MENKNCQNCKNEFVIESEDFNFYEKMKVPAPSFCPDCRLQRRLAWRNERSLYKRKCDLCASDMLAMYDPEGPIKTYCSACWWSDSWNPLEYEKEFDFSKTFFEQFKELMHQVPHQNMSVSYKTLLNSDYCNMNHALKHCYLLFNSDYNENCLYGEEVEHSKDCMNITMIDGSELIFNSVNCIKCFNVHYSLDCESSHDIYFSKNLVNCSNCIGCVNLRGKENHIFNQPYSKEEYAKKVAELNFGSFESTEKIKQEAKNFWLEFPNKFMHGKQNADVSGDYISNSRNIHQSYIVTGSDHCKFCMWLIVKPNKDCYDFTQFGENAQEVYEALVCGKNIASLISCQFVQETHHAQYSMNCFNNCSDVFGCIGLRSSKYCILNKQYTKEKYEELVPKIIEHMKKTGEYGEFFPSAISPFAYNETTAQEYFPLMKEKALSLGYKWKDAIERKYQIDIKPEEIPDHINDVEDDIANKVIGCAHAGECEHNCTTAFKIIPRELEFYKRASIPLSRLCPNCRHYERIDQRNSPKLLKRSCQCAGVKSENRVYQNTIKHVHGDESCANEFETSYLPDQLDIVYCDQCYKQEVY